MIHIVKVTNKHTLKEFIQFPNTLYKNCEQFVPDLEQDVYNSLDINKNPALVFCEYQAFLAYRGNRVVGRIVGIINPRANNTWGTKYVRFGYVDFIDDIDVSESLINEVIKWGKEKGMTKIQGPMGFTDYDKEGMLIGDYDLMGSMNTIYNYPYYKTHMERLGFEKDAEWIQIKIDFPKELPQRFCKIAKLIKQRLKLHVTTVSKAQMYGEKGHEVFHLLNKAYAPLFCFTPFDESQIDYFLKQYVPLLNNKMMPVIENQENEVVGIAITLPSMSHALQKSKGKLFPFGWFHLIKSLKWRYEDTMELLLIGIRPDYQGKGVNSLFFEQLMGVCKNYGFKYAETCPQLVDNNKELSQWKELNPTYIKPRRCWKKDIAF